MWITRVEASGYRFRCLVLVGVRVWAGLNGVWLDLRNTSCRRCLCRLGSVLRRGLRGERVMLVGLTPMGWVGVGHQQRALFHPYRLPLHASSQHRLLLGPSRVQIRYPVPAQDQQSTLRLPCPPLGGSWENNWEWRQSKNRRLLQLQLLAPPLV